MKILIFYTFYAINLNYYLSEVIILIDHILNLYTFTPYSKQHSNKHLYTQLNTKADYCCIYVNQQLLSAHTVFTSPIKCMTTHTKSTQG